MPIACSGGGSSDAPGQEDAPRPPGLEASVLPGIDVLLRDSLHLVRERRVGLITNRSGVARDGRTSIDVLYEHPEVDLVALFAPEHSYRADRDEGLPIEDEVDPATGLPVFSLYGETREPTAEMLAELDVLAFDIQDVGARYYTYVSTMAYAMRAAGAAGVPFLVLDRPNPIGGAVQGPILDPAFATFVGLYPVPARHGMTPGELARLYAGEFGIEVEIHVAPVEGWRRDAWFDATGLPWIPPSPNMPSLESATHYPGTCLFEGTNVSTGRGTATAFQVLGAPFLDGDAWADALGGYDLPGVGIEPIVFTPRDPSDGKYPGTEVSGIRLTVTDRGAYDPVRTAVAALLEARRLAGDAWEWNERHFDRLAGSDALRLAIDEGAPLRTILAPWGPALAEFETLRAPYLIY